MITVPSSATSRAWHRTWANSILANNRSWIGFSISSSWVDDRRYLLKGSGTKWSASISLCQWSKRREKEQRKHMYDTAWIISQILVKIFDSILKISITLIVQAILAQVLMSTYMYYEVSHVWHNSHSDAKNFTCKLCSKKFASKTFLMALHHRLHSGQSHTEVLQLSGVASSFVIVNTSKYTSILTSKFKNCLLPLKTVKPTV